MGESEGGREGGREVGRDNIKLIGEILRELDVDKVEV